MADRTAVPGSPFGAIEAAIDAVLLRGTQQVTREELTKLRTLLASRARLQAGETAQRAGVLQPTQQRDELRRGLKLLRAALREDGGTLGTLALDTLYTVCLQKCDALLVSISDSRLPVSHQARREKRGPADKH
jgi:hypothetical protein